MKKHKKKSLFTLLEVLVSMGVFSLLMLALMQFFSAAQGVWERSGGKSELLDSIRIASQLLTTDLGSAFYGDAYHEMGDSSDKYIFYKTETDSSDKVHLTFAALRGEENGLTEVNYVWDPADLTLSVQELSEKDENAAIGEAGWVNYPSNSWIAGVRSRPAIPLVEDVLYFKVQNYYYNNSSTAPADNPGVAFRPPYMVFITFAVLSSTGYEKLDTILRPSAAGSTDDAKAASVRAQIRTYFTAMFDADKDKFKDDAVPESGSDVPAKQILQDEVQVIKLIIPIER